MGWVKKRNYDHECVKPWTWNARRKGYGLGSVWECDFCKTQWTLSRVHNKTYNDWSWYWSKKTS